MKLDPTTYHRWRFAAALALFPECEFKAATKEEALLLFWSHVDAFLAAGGYDGSALQEPADEDWREAVVDWKKDRTAPIDAISPEGLVWISRRAHELARQRSQK